jgi:hypothetical protein
MDAKNSGIVPVDDPLIVYDRNLQPTTALKNIWRGCAAFLCGGGPSIKAMPYEKLAERGVCSLGINNIAGMVPVKAFTQSDPPEKAHPGIYRDPGIIKLLPKPKLSTGKKGRLREKRPDGSFKYLKTKTQDCPNVWGYERDDWYTPETFLTQTGASLGNNDKGVAKTGRTKIICSMFLGLRLLHYLGVRRVYLLGVDFHMDKSMADTKVGNYAFDEHRDEDAIRANNDLYTVAAAMLAELKPHFDRAGFGVFNCNKWSYLRAFPYVPFEAALKDCRNGVPEGPLDLQGWYVKGEQPAPSPATTAPELPARQDAA